MELFAKAKLKPIGTAFEELGVLHTFVFLGSFVIIFFFEDVKQDQAPLSSRWLIAGIISYTVFAFYFGWFFTSIVPRNYKRHGVISYLQRRTMDISILISFVIMELIERGNGGDPNKRDRSDEELAAICGRVKVYQTFKPHFERNDDYADFYEYFSFIATQINATAEKILLLVDVLTEEEIRILFQIENDTNSALTRNLKFSAGKIDNQPATAYIPEAYAYAINRLRKNSKALLRSVGIPDSIA